jgi:hypothetical protein
MRFLCVYLRCVVVGVALLTILGAALLGHFVTLMVFVSSRDEGPSGVWAAAAYLGGLIAATWLALAAHEGGHLLAARLCGLAPWFARIGPVTLTRVGSQWQAGWTWRHNWLDGIALCFLPGTCRWKRLVVLAGGPLGNLAVGIVAGSLAVMHLSPVGRCWALLLAVNCLFFGLANLLPLQEKLSSDGLAIWRVLRGNTTDA